MPVFEVRLEQHEWVTTEFNHVEAETQEEAEQKAQAWVEDKDIQVDHRTTVTELPAENAVADDDETSVEDEDAAPQDQNAQDV